MKFWVKRQEVDQSMRVETMVNVCDEDVLGKELKKGVRASEHFYKGVLMDETEMLAELDKGTLINLLGNGCVGAAMKRGIVSKDGVIVLGKYKHAIIISD